MARIFIDGFESGDHDMWDSEYIATVISSAGKDMDGSYCLDMLGNTEFLSRGITADDEMYFAFLYRPNSDDGSRGILSLWNNATGMVYIRRNSVSCKLQAYRGAVLVETGDIALSYNATYLVEVRVLIHDGSGRIVTKVNGIPDIDFTGDTKTGADTQFNIVKIGYDNTTGQYSRAYFDNFIMDDSAWIGDTRIQAVVPTGAGNTTGWTPSVGNNWECVDEKPPNDADYVSTNTNDITDTYATGDMAGTVGAVKCVQVQSRAITEGSPTPTNLKLVVRSGGADYLSGDKAVPASEKSLYHLWENNPADAAAWEEADVNAMEIGVKSAA